MIGVAGNDGRTGITALQQTLPGIQEQAALHFFSLVTVTLIAILREHRANSVFEELKLGGGGIGRMGGA
jgi:hypothetical protein